MDYTFAELMTREQLLNILVERQLNIPNLNEMANEELVRIYKSFALPLARREVNRSTKNRPEANDSHKQSSNEQNRQNYLENTALPMDVDQSVHNQLSCERSSETSSMLSGRIMACEKRSRDYKQLNPLTDEFLSIATKRIKIAWT
ncbi:PREDICTED: uncharacterized protein LOC108376240 [Rhagoletis zephyria]|uniref:uncharacterized protein LOC108376240 n=1 Tax=Rhagoletis zephyria TaxID=28612 RepID=UPI00081127C9|nr:PREDICTED: uncharacterized protein LOC108376240 [Rhagoletis zephyria]